MPNNHFSTTNLAASDVVLDNPSAGSNFCTWNPISGPPRTSSTVLGEGNLKVTGQYNSSAQYYPRFMGTMAASSGKWFYELRKNGATSGWYEEAGFKGINTTWPVGSHGLGGGSTAGQWVSEGEIAWNANDGGIRVSHSGTALATGVGGGFSADGDIIGLALDLDASPRTLKFFKNGSATTSTTASVDLPTGGPDAFHPALDCTNTILSTTTANFGQDATFAGTESGTTYTTDASGGDTGGEFTMQPPAGYKAWTTKNLTASIAKPSEHFDTKIWTGNGSSSDRDITGLSFEPDLIWYKSRTDATHHCVQDDVRGWGATKIGTNSTATEDSSNFETQYGYIKASVSGSGTANGFTVAQGASGTQDMVHTNMSAKNYVAWNWKGGTSLTQSGTHTYELQLEVTDSGGDGWGDWGSYTTPRLQVWEGATSLGYASHIYDGNSDPQYYTIKTNNKDAIKIVWDYDSSNTGTLNQQGATLTNGSTVIQTAYTTSDTLYDGEVWITQSTSTNESTVGTLATGTPASYPSSNYNAAAGFSIVTYTGNDYDSAGTEQTVNHNLGVAPEMIIIKGRTDNYGMAAGWGVYHKDLTTDYLLYLNSNAAEAYPSGGISYINNIGATSVDFASYYGDGFNYGGDMSYSADDYVAYFFASVAGYSMCGSYEGNNSTDGPFVYCGFRPRWICVKRIDGLGPWVIIDTARDPYNDTDATLAADTSSAESSYAATSDFDILSNGFKLRHSVTYGYANNADTYIFLAMAESPLKTALAR